MQQADITPDSVITRNDDMVAGEVDADIMIMSLDSGKYFQLNPVGGEVWNALHEPLAVSELFDVLENKFSVERTLLERETLEFLGELLSRQIIFIS